MGIRLPKIDSVISTFFGIGKIPFMPGTWGSLAAIVIAAAMFYQPYFVERDGVMLLEMGAGIINPKYLPYIFPLVAVLTYILGVWASESHCNREKIKDPGKIVIDEVSGIFTTVSFIVIIFAGLLYYNESEYILYIMLAHWFFPIAFVLFRFFDIVKPLGVKKLEHLYDGGVGIMIDDQLAGIYAAISFYIIFFGLKFSGILDSLITV